MDHLINITKADGTKEPFEESKLIYSLKNAGGEDEIVNKIVDHIQSEIHDGVSTSEIYGHAFKLLHSHSIPLAIKYSMRRAISDFGPDGFPFEKYIARIFNEKGYETLIDQNVAGHCVSHEIDVVAWNKEKLCMIEAKFHNEFGLKSDLKVVLYVKARFDDLRESTFNYGNINRRPDEGWLVTNTKFTDQAIKYGECRGIKMIGWNYPKKGNLQDIIEELRLHPITCLINLSNFYKKQLLAKGVVLCKDILDKPELLEEIGMKNDEKEKVLNETRVTCGI